jgi:glycerophosphoryl diester phosphodiesterase
VPNKTPFAVGLPALLAVAALGAGCHGTKPLHAYFQAQHLPVVVAHRGGGGTEPEATLRTMQATHMRNPEAIIEFDVYRSSDGQLIVMHDATVDRTTNGSGRVADMTVAELKALDAGYCATPNQGNGTNFGGACHDGDAADYPFRGQGYQVPTLQEVLDGLPVDTFISVEVKQAGIERQVADQLRASGSLGRMIVGAEFDDLATRVKDALPEVPGYLPTAAAKCFVLSSKAGWDYPACPFYEVFASPLSGAGLPLDTHGVLDAAHDEGMAVVYWTINDEPTMERLFLLGADGIYTDYPDQARAVLERLRAAGLVK